MGLQSIAAETNGDFLGNLEKVLTQDGRSAY